MKSNTVNINRVGELQYITFPKLSAAPGVRHVFSTRKGGVSGAPYGEMNLSFNNGDSRENVLENYRRICSAAGIDPSRLVLSRQTHTKNIKTVTAKDIGTGVYKPSFHDVDGLITNEPGVALVTQYADCVPLLFYDPVARVCANSHSGWRGTALKIGAETVKRMRGEFGCKPENIIAAIGPCICKNCYEVDLPVYNAFKESGLSPDIFTPVDSEHFLLDLRLANREILLGAGILPENLDVADLCTAENSRFLHSHRATGGKRGNLAAIIEMI
ncbi:MAG: peptidoglycan editing factor PgeF [Clostridia bacterium]|nr:peptidoglycan editing factor PgeF [Clostridia bacterium]MBR5923445.1 peptidoglycan editing factor PgeF [Clostridia bacterium]